MRLRVSSRLAASQRAELSEVKFGEKHLFEATSIIQELIADPKTETGLSPEELEALLDGAKAGRAGCEARVRQLLVSLMDRYGLSVEGMDAEAAAYRMYSYLWGLDVVEDLYRRPDVDEIRVNGPGRVYYQERGRNAKSSVTFKDAEHVRKIIGRLLEHDRLAVDDNTPAAESRRLDGSRVTALVPPLVREPLLVIRRHGTFDISDSNYVASGTMDLYTQRLLQVLVRGRSNILICGDTGTGKTTLLRWLVGFLHPALRVVTVEMDRELFLEEWYPDRDIVSIEAHPELGWDMRRCFIAALRLTPDSLIVGEARGLGEAGQMVNACRRGHHGSMGTIHVRSAYEAVETLAQMIIEEGLHLPVSVLEDRVASAFDVVVQMYGSSISGTRRIERVVELVRRKDGPEFRDLCVWEPSAEDYEVGEWRHPHPLSEGLAAKLFRHGVGPKALRELEEMRRA